MEFLIQNVIKIYFLVSIFLFILLIPRLYYFTAAFKKQPKLKNKELNRFALMIPARNESKIISHLINSIKNQDYDANLFDVHIIVNHKLDPTINIVKNSLNATIHIVPNQKRKGDALDGAIKSILKNKNLNYDAFIIIDADNILETNFLTEMNNAMVMDRQIIIGKKLNKNWRSFDNPNRSVISNCTGLLFIMVDELGNRYRTKHNITVSISGSNLLVRGDLMKKLNGWPYKTLTEDYELTANALLHGFSTGYYSHAITYTEEPKEHKASFKRRLRWLSGFSECKKLYRRKIFKKTFFEDKVKWKNIDFLYSLLPVYLFAGISLFLGIVSLAAAAAYAIFLQPIWKTLLIAGLIPLTLIYLTMVIYTIFTLFVDRHNIKLSIQELILVVLLNPFILGEFIIIFIRLFLFKNNVEWVPIDRAYYISDKDE
jgi:cellulose synthase/poly-beta-1,6-N-acetylglucosamine synthase-like glycosyltransferase